MCTCLIGLEIQYCPICPKFKSLHAARACFPYDASVHIDFHTKTFFWPLNLFSVQTKKKNQKFVWSKKDVFWSRIFVRSRRIKFGTNHLLVNILFWVHHVHYCHNVHHVHLVHHVHHDHVGDTNPDLHLVWPSTWNREATIPIFFVGIVKRGRIYIIDITILKRKRNCIGVSDVFWKIILLFSLFFLRVNQWISYGSSEIKIYFFRNHFIDKQTNAPHTFKINIFAPYIFPRVI